MKIPALIVLLSFYMAPTSNADSNLLTDNLRAYAQKMEKDARPGQESIDEYIRILDLVQPEKPINVEVVNKRIETMGIVDALIIPSLLEMDYLLAEGNFQQAEILNIAISKLDRNMSNQLGKTFGLNNDEVQFDLSSINTQNDTFNFERSFGDQYTNFGDRGGFGDDRGGFGGDRGGFGGDRGGFGGDRGGFGDERTSFSNRRSPIFGDPTARSTVSYRSRGGECVAGCNSGIGPGASIGTAAGGLIGTILTGPAGTLPGASGGALAGGAIGCIVGCISGPPETTTPSTTTPETTTPSTTTPATTTPATTPPETTPPETTTPETTPPETTTPETTNPETSNPETSNPEATTPDNNPRPKKPEDQVRTVNPDSELGGAIFTNPGRRVNGTNTNLIRILNNNDAPLTNYGQPRI